MSRTVGVGRDKKYIIRSKKLGRGSFGSIYLGVDKTTNQEVAVKLVPFSLFLNQIILLLRHITVGYLVIFLGFFGN